MHANPQQTHARFRGRILQPLVTQHAKSAICVPQVTEKESNMHKVHPKLSRQETPKERGSHSPLPQGHILPYPN